MPRRIIWLVSLLLAPVLVLTGPMGPASAVYSATVSGATLSAGGRLGHVCSTAGYYDVGSFHQAAIVKLACNGRTPLVSYPWGGQTRITVKGAMPGTQAACGGSLVTTIEGTGGIFSIGTGRAKATIPTQIGCQVREVCMTDYKKAIDWTFDYEYNGTWCGALDLGKTPALSYPTQSCVKAEVTRPKTQYLGVQPVPWETTRKAQLYRAQTNVQAKPDAGTGTWNSYVVIRPFDSVMSGPAFDQGWSQEFDISRILNYGDAGKREARDHIVVITGQDSITPGTSKMVGNAVRVSRREINQSNYADPIRRGEVVGVGLFWSPDLLGQGATQLQMQFPYSTSYPLGRVGRTQPGGCSFYWGKPLYNVDATTADEGSDPDWAPDEPPTPGAVDEPTDEVVSPDEGQETCDFSLTDPASWLSGGMCAAVGLLGGIFEVLMGVLALLGDILAAVAGLGLTIAQALGDMLRSMFSVSPGAWGFGALVDELKTRPPGSLVVSVSQLVSGFGDGMKSSSCATLYDSDVASLNCTDVRDVPGYSVLYALAQAAIVAAACWACVTMWMRALGGGRA